MDMQKVAAHHPTTQPTPQSSAALKHSTAVERSVSRAQLHASALVHSSTSSTRSRLHPLVEALACLHQLCSEGLLVGPDLLQEGLLVLLKRKPGAAIAAEEHSSTAER